MADYIPEQSGNRILDSLPHDERAEVVRVARRVRLETRQVLIEPDERIQAVYFPVDAVLSMVVWSDEGVGVEAATIGNEGVLGVSVVLGVPRQAPQSLSQIPGHAWRVTTTDFVPLVERLDELRRRTLAYAHALMMQMGQSAACNRMHSLEERAARWLLMTHDRVGQHSFSLTQEFLAFMLGVHRPSVTLAAGMLQKAGFIAYSRGRIDIVDRAGLMAASCECYGVIQREYEAAVGREGTPMAAHPAPGAK